jgi:hypothetical protein
LEEQQIVPNDVVLAHITRIQPVQICTMKRRIVSRAVLANMLHILAKKFVIGAVMENILQILVPQSARCAVLVNIQRHLGEPMIVIFVMPESTTMAIRWRTTTTKKMIVLLAVQECMLQKMVQQSVQYAALVNTRGFREDQQIVIKVASLANTSVIAQMQMHTTKKPIVLIVTQVHMLLPEGR